MKNLESIYIYMCVSVCVVSLRRFSPEVKVKVPANRKAISLLPRTILFHGTGDYSIPCHSSKSTLERVDGVEAEAIMYEGKTHTDIFLQDPMRGGDDEMIPDLVEVIHAGAGDEEALDKHQKAPPSERLAPEFMLKLACSYNC